MKKTLLLAIVALAVVATGGFAANLGEECKTGRNIDQELLCPIGTTCLQGIGKMYCSNAGKVCGWPGASGYNLGAQKQYQGRQYECTITGFKRSTGEECSSGSSCATGLCLTAISKQYCSNVGKVCGWRDSSGYALGQTQSWQGKEYECQLGGFEEVEAEPTNPAALIAALLSQGQSAVSIANAVKSAFPGTGGGQMAQLLEDAGFAVLEVAQALKVALNANANATAGWLLDAGFPVTAVVQAIQQVFNVTYSVIATIMKAEGMSVTVILQAMKAVSPNLDEDQAAAEFKRLGGYASAPLLQAFEAVLAVEPAIAGPALLAVGFPPSDVVAGMKARNALTVDAMKRLMTVAHEVGATTVKGAIVALKRANLARSAVESVMLAIRKWSRSQVDALLDEAYGPVRS